MAEVDPKRVKTIKIKTGVVKRYIKLVLQCTGYMMVRYLGDNRLISWSLV